VRPDRISYNAQAKTLANPDRTFAVPTAIGVHVKPGTCVCAYVHIRSDFHCRDTTHTNGYFSSNTHAAATNTHTNGYPSPNAHAPAANTHTNGYPSPNAHTHAYSHP
jgi:hypothetical protein